MVIVVGLSLSGHRFRDRAAPTQYFAVSKLKWGLQVVAKM